MHEELDSVPGVACLLFIRCVIYFGIANLQWSVQFRNAAVHLFLSF